MILRGDLDPKFWKHVFEITVDQVLRSQTLWCHCDKSHFSHKNTIFSKQHQNHDSPLPIYRYKSAELLLKISARLDKKGRVLLKNVCKFIWMVEILAHYLAKKSIFFNEKMIPSLFDKYHQIARSPQFSVKNNVKYGFFAQKNSKTTKMQFSQFAFWLITLDTINIFP